MWNLNTYECVKTLEHPDWVGAILVLDKDKIVSGCGDGKLRVSFATLTVLSYEPETMYSSVFTIHDTARVCPSKVLTHSNLFESHT